MKISFVSRALKIIIKKEALRFFIAGSINTIFCYILYIISLYSGFQRTSAMSFATLSTVFLSFIVMGRYVFASDLTKKRLAAFLLMHGIGYVFNIGILMLTSLSEFPDYLSGIISLSCTAIFTFFISKYIVFMKNKRQR